VYQGILNDYRVRVVFKKDVALPLLGVSYKANTEADLPLYLALSLEEVGAVEIDEGSLIAPKDVTTYKYMEQRETYPVQLPEGFYARVKLTVHALNKRGDSKGARAMAQDLRELLIERVRKIAVLVATKPDVVSDQGFLERLTPEEKALLNSMYATISSFIAAVMP